MITVITNQSVKSEKTYKKVFLYNVYASDNTPLYFILNTKHTTSPVTARCTFSNAHQRVNGAKTDLSRADTIRPIPIRLIKSLRPWLLPTPLFPCLIPITLV